MQAFGSRRKARRIGGGPEDDDVASSNSEQDSESVVKRPQSHSKPKQRSKLRLSFNPGETSMNDEEDETSGIFTLKKANLGRQAVERSALQRSNTPSGSAEHLPIRAGQAEERPTYNRDYLNELRNSTPSTPRNLGSLPTSEEDERPVDVVAKFGTDLIGADQSLIPSEAEIKEKKERRARLAIEQDFISLDDDDNGREVSLLPKKHKPETRLVRDDEDFGEGFDEFVEDGKISLGKRAEREQHRKARAEMRDMIKEAEGSSSGEDSDRERNVAYEAAQTRAGMDGLHHAVKQQRPKTPPKITPLPRLSACVERLKSTFTELEQNKVLLARKMDEIQAEKEEIATREVEIQRLLKEAGSNYERLRAEAGIQDGAEKVEERGLENLGGRTLAT